MKGYVARKGQRRYPVIYEGLDPVFGQIRRTWHAVGTSHDNAEQLATRLAAIRLQNMRHTAPRRC